MDSTVENDGRQVEYISLVESLTGEWIKLPLAVMQDCGPAVQTLGGLLEVTNKETFVKTATIARNARLPVATVRKHLKTLHRSGWIRNKGRQEIRRGRLRRTATIAVTAKTREHLEPYGALPWWGCCPIGTVGRLPWSARAVLSLVMSRLMRFSAAVERQKNCGGDPDDLEGTLLNWGGDRRWQFGRSWLVDQTGLDLKSVTSAKRWLSRAKVVDWVGDTDPSGWNGKDKLIPNWDFRVVVTPRQAGYFSVSCKG